MFASSRVAQASKWLFATSSTTVLYLGSESQSSILPDQKADTTGLLIEKLQEMDRDEVVSTAEKVTELVDLAAEYGYNFTNLVTPLEEQEGKR